MGIVVNKQKSTNPCFECYICTGNREYTVFSTKYWTLRIFMIIMFESHSLPPSCIMYSITGRHFSFIMIKSSYIMKQYLYAEIENARIINANKYV